MKVKFESVEKGIISYLDSELLAQYPANGPQKWIIGSGIALIFRNTAGKVYDFLMGSTGKLLGISDENGLIDIDLVREVLKYRMPTDGVRIEAPLIDITLKSEDIDVLYRYVTDATKEVTT